MLSFLQTCISLSFFLIYSKYRHSIADNFHVFYVFFSLLYLPLLHPSPQVFLLVVCNSSLILCAFHCVFSPSLEFQMAQSDSWCHHKSCFLFSMPHLAQVLLPLELAYFPSTVVLPTVLDGRMPTFSFSWVFLIL